MRCQSDALFYQQLHVLLVLDVLLQTLLYSHSIKYADMIFHGTIKGVQCTEPENSPKSLSAASMIVLMPQDPLWSFALPREVMTHPTRSPSGRFLRRVSVTHRPLSVPGRLKRWRYIKVKRYRRLRKKKTNRWKMVKYAGQWYVAKQVGCEWSEIRFCEWHEMWRTMVILGQWRP